ncbi:MAG TPA: NUDIX hydrolase [Terriglobia bacterium]
MGGVVIENGQVLLVRRGREPLKGDWSIPGGLVEIGESLAEALWREVKEETGLEIEPLEVIGVFERILRGVRSSGRSNRVRYHYILIDYACRLDPGGRRRKRGGPGSNDPRAASDVSEARWVRREELAQYRLTPEAHDLILEAFRWLSETRWAK